MTHLNISMVKSFILFVCFYYVEHCHNSFGNCNIWFQIIYFFSTSISSLLFMMWPNETFFFLWIHREKSDLKNQQFNWSLLSGFITFGWFNISFLWKSSKSDFSSKAWKWLLESSKSASDLEKKKTPFL